MLMERECIGRKPRAKIMCAQVPCYLHVEAKRQMHKGKLFDLTTISPGVVVGVNSIMY
jgi:hypothetical protein